MPLFIEPSSVSDPQLLMFSPHMQMQPYTPAEHFFPWYVQQCFGNAPGFQILSVATDPERNQTIAADFQKSGRQFHCTSARVTFRYQHNGQVMTSELRGSTTTIGTMWMADFFALSTAGKLEDYQSLALRVVMSTQVHPAWKAAQQRLHNQRMQDGQQQLDHMNEMSRISAAGHQQRMNDIANAGHVNTQIHNQRMAQQDAQFEGWRAQQNLSDQGHQTWMQNQVADDHAQQARINMIREEHTVADEAGNTYQVSAHHERYYVNTRDNTYIGVSSATELEDLRRQYGVNPDDYREVKVVR
jgi:hypothetical protein